MENLTALQGTTFLASAIALAHMTTHTATINNQLSEMPHTVYQTAGELAVALLLFRVQKIATL